MSQDPAGRREPSEVGETEYDGPGAWGAWALGLLAALFLIATGATVHSIIVTLGG